MIVPVETEIRSKCNTALSKGKNTANVQLHVLAGCDLEEAEKIRRRWHIHLCLVSLSSLAYLLAALSVLDASVIVVFVPACFGACQEFIDYIGQY